MKKFTYLFIYLSIYLSVSLNGQVINSQEKAENAGIKRNALYNLEEIKVRWKKAALENCTGVPCVVAPPLPSFTCGTSTISDYDGNVYNTVSIGTQCWTKQNLKVTKYNDGTAIPLNNTYTSGTVSTVWQGLTTGAYTIYGNEPSTGANAINYGFLYNWYAAAGIITPMGSPTKNICTTGWHVPTDGEWASLIQFIDPTANAIAPGSQSTTAGGKLKSTSLLWNSGSPGTDNYGFSALPGGFRYLDGSFQDIRNISFFWSATDYPSNDAWNRNLNFFSSDVNKYNYLKSLGGSIRCLKD